MSLQRFLERMQEALLARHRKQAITLRKTPTVLSASIDADDGDPEIDFLPPRKKLRLPGSKIVDHPVDLLDHRLPEHVDLDADLHSRDIGPQATR